MKVQRKPVGRPRKATTSQSVNNSNRQTTPSSADPSIVFSIILSSSSDNESDHEAGMTATPPTKKRGRGTYHTYGYSMKLSVVTELANIPISVHI